MFNKNFILVFFMYIILTVMTVYYILHDKVPLSWDQSGYMTVSAQIGHALKESAFLKAIKIFIWHDVWSNRPGMFMFIGGVFAALSNFNPNLIVILSNMFWMFILVISTYKLSEYFKHESGLLSIFLIFSSYSIIFLYRDFGCDMALTAGVILVEALFFRSKKLLDLKWSLFTLLAIVFCALIKETFILYLFPIFIYSTIQLLYNPAYKNKRASSIYLIVYGCSFLIISSFYVPILIPLLKNMFDNIGSVVGDFYSRPYPKDSLNYYLVYLYFMSFITSILYVIIPILGWFLNIIFIKKQTKFKINENIILVLSLTVFPTIILTFFVVDTAFRFLLPVLPLTLICCSVITNSLSTLIKKIFVLLLIFVGCANAFSAISKISFLPIAFSIKGINIFQQHYNDSSILGGRFGFSNMTNDYVSKVIDVIDILMQDGCKSCNTGVIVATPYLNENIFQSYAALSNKSIVFLGIGNVTDLSICDYIITTDGNKINYDPKVKDDKINQINYFVINGLKTSKFRLIKKILLPDSTNLLIIKRINGKIML